MKPPTACPRCSSNRIWLEPAAADAFTGRCQVRCTVCRREGTACVRCGWEFVAAGPRAGECACAGVNVLGRAGGRWPSGASIQARTAVALADADEGHSILCYRARRCLAPAVAEAANRAAATARLEAALRHPAAG